MLQLTEKQLRILDLLIELNDLEVMQHEQLATRSGRTLYFQIAKSIRKDPRKRSYLKQRTGNVSERSLRGRMRSFEHLNLLECLAGVEDARTRKLVPTQRFIDLVALHLSSYQKVLETHFHLVSKH
jgi:hypothetical protein